jgi:prophage regulatory protein
MQNPSGKKALAGLYRLPHIIGDPNARPPIPAQVPVCAATWWAGVKSGRFPQPIKLSPRVTVWRAQEIHDFVASLHGGEKA